MNDKKLINQLIRAEAALLTAHHEMLQTRKLIEKEARVSTPAKDRPKDDGVRHTERLFRRLAKKGVVLK